GEESAGPTLVRAVFLRREPVREAALWALAALGSSGRRGSPGAAPPGELDTIAGKPDAHAYIARLSPSCPLDCQNQMGRLTDPLALGAIQPALKDALSRHRDLVLRTLRDLDVEGDAIVLGPLGALPEAAELVSPLAPELGALTGHTDPGVRLHAMRLLAKLGVPAAEA